MKLRWAWWLLLLAGCSHAPPSVVQIFGQVNRVYDPATEAWSSRLSAFVQASSTDGNRVFDRLHLIHDGQELFYTLGVGQWTAVERPGEFWVGTNGLSLPDGTIPTGTWRAVLVTRAGQRVEASFAVPPLAPDAGPARTGRVVVAPVAGAPERRRITGWVDDTLVWFRDARGAALTRVKVVGPEFVVPAGAATLLLYSYDKNRGEGLLAGPFPVQEPEKPADR